VAVGVLCVRLCIDHVGLIRGDRPGGFITKWLLQTEFTFGKDRQVYIPFEVLEEL
jgi:hypothetical protein